MRHLVMCYRIEDRPQPEISSSRRYCATCGEAVWADLEILLVEKVHEIEFICSHCCYLEATG